MAALVKMRRPVMNCEDAAPAFCFVCVSDVWGYDGRLEKPGSVCVCVSGVTSSSCVTDGSASRMR